MKKNLLLLLCAVLFITTAAAQEVSEKKEIAVFSLSYSDWSIPTGALGIVDQQVITVLANLGRFDVKGLEFRLAADDVAGFIDMVKKMNESNMVVEDKFRLGEETFTEADFLNLVASFIIVIPSLTYYDSLYADNLWEVELQTAFSFIRVKDSTTIAQFSIDTYGSGETQQDATREAAEAITSQLEFKLRSIEEFKLKSGVVEVLNGGNVIIELGSGMGLKKGDEFSILGTTVLASGHIIQNNTGLIVISDVKKDVSFGRVLYSNTPLIAGAQLAEIPRTGMDTSVYGRMFMDNNGISGGALGVKAVFARGFYDMRPYFGLEIPVVDGTLNNLWPGLPASVYLGGEMIWYIKRLQIEPSIALGATGLVPVNDNEQFILSHIGGTAGLAFNWMFSDSMRIYAEGGYSYWYTWLTNLNAYGGIFAGLGVTFKL